MILMSIKLASILLKFSLLMTSCNSTAKLKSIDDQKTIQFLQRYGYMTSRFSGNYLINERIRVENAIKLLQKRYGIRQSGLLDNKTFTLMLSARCGNADNNREHRRVKRYVIDEKTKWPIRNITYKIRSFPTSGLSRRKVHKIFQSAFNLWSQHSNLTFVEVFDTTKDANIIIEFAKKRHGDYIPFDGPGKVLAHAYLPDKDDSGYTRSGDAHFDDDEPWRDSSSSSGKNLLAVAVHEIGHSLGLGHSFNHSSVMFPYYKEENNGIFLQDDDILAIESLYGRPSKHKNLTTRENFPDDHLTNLPPSTTTQTFLYGSPDLCNTSVDAIMIVRNSELFAFRKSFCWRVGSSLLINQWRSYELIGKPTHFGNLWKVLYENGIVGGIDAAIEDPFSQQFYIFKGRKFWILESFVEFRSNFTESGEPLSVLGLPATLEKIDTIFTWGYNHAAYIFSGKFYWKFDFSRGKYGRVYSSPNYPRNIRSVWIGVPDNVDAAFSDLHENTYFIKNKSLYLFNDIEMKVQEGYPRPLKLAWLGCSRDL